MTIGTAPESMPEPPAKAAPTWRLPLVTGVVGLAIGLLIGGVGLGVFNNVSASNAAGVQASASASAEASRKTVFATAAAVCTSDTKSAAVGDGGLSLTLDAKGTEDFAGLSTKELFCIMGKLKAPDSVIAEMQQTRALDGRQTATWDDISASWAYHPDSGMEAVLSMK